MACSETDWPSCMKAAAIKMLENETVIDVKFVFPRDDLGKIPLVRAHKFVLMARSIIFHNMFEEAGMEYVDIDDIEPEVFEIMIRYLYTDEIQLTACNALPVLHAALKYKITRLIRECWEYLSRSLTKWNVTLILDMAVENNERDTILACLNFLRYGGPESFASLKRHHISEKTLEVILDDDKCICEEVDLFVFCDRWAGIECGRRDLQNNAEKKRGVLGKLLYKLRLPAMRSEELINVVAKSGLINEAEMAQILNNNKPNSSERNTLTDMLPNEQDLTENSTSTDEDKVKTFPTQARSDFPISCTLVDIDEEVEVFEIISDVDWMFQGFVTRREKRLSFKEAYFQYKDINTRMMAKTVGEYSHHFCIQTTEFKRGEKIDVFVQKNASQVGVYPTGRCGYNSSKDDPDPLILKRPDLEDTTGIKIKMFGERYSVCGLIFSVSLKKGENFFDVPSELAKLAIYE